MRRGNQVHADKRSGIVNAPDRADDPQYIVKPVGKIITVSLKIVKIVKGLPSLLSTAVIDYALQPIDPQQHLRCSLLLPQI